MKTNLYKAYHKTILLLFCFGSITNVLAGPPDPLLDPITPPEDIIPIDANIVILVIVAILFGIYTIYKHKLNQKRPA